MKSTSDKKVQMAWGFNSKGSPVHISNVKKEVDSNFFCIDCGQRIVAKQGKKKNWHFAHKIACKCNGESVLHYIAKKAIADSLNAEMTLPNFYLKVNSIDLYGKDDVFVHEESLGSSVISMAKDEVQLGDQIVDSMINQGLEGELAIEIYVTHKKSDDDILKFREKRVNVIEIDLSEIPWDASFETIKEQVLNGAPRKWLNYNLECDIKAKAIDRRLKELKRLDEQLRQDFYQEVQHACSIGRTDFFYKEFWEKREGRSADGTFLESVVKIKPRIIRLNNDLKKVSGGYRATAIVKVKKEIPIHVYFLLDMDELKVENARPYFQLKYSPSGRYGSDVFHASWNNIESWMRKLSMLADSKLKEKIAQQDSFNIASKKFIKKIDAMTEADKMKFFYNRVNSKLSPPFSPGKFHISWNCCEHVWKSVVYHYKIQGRQQILATDEISNDEWIVSILNLPNNQKDNVIRSKMLYKFFRELSDAGVLHKPNGLAFRCKPKKTSGINMGVGLASN